ncbi:SDR family NAD(P)-dependent oxidoreductase [Rhabdothermincola sediminis]|uniref:SDR family NAD(P)-dependent oxidoreductase n=1 Tax=Rhabdothermincola sediminis TaxID=2751370 RepID=UPI001AA07768|nr:SDR family NAD(P)-dependent oxidoreductase [Rhabdothermincola sediminis]
MGLVDGKVAIVTGAGRGVGRGEALELAAQGAKVVVNDFGGSSKGEGGDQGPADEVVDIIRQRGGEAVANYGDVSDWSDAEALVQQAVDTFGGLDILVNNAGILRDVSITKMTEQDWDAVIRVHLKGTFAMTHFACLYWQNESKAGRPRRASIINTVSSAGLQGNPGQANYGAAKAGIAALTTITALEGKRYGVRANAIAPGGATRMVHEAMPQIPIVEADQVGPDDEFQRLNPGNSAPMVVWLAADESQHISGQVFRAVGDEITHYVGWTLGRSVKAGKEPQKWDPAKIGDAVASGIFGYRPGGLAMGGG